MTLEEMNRRFVEPEGDRDRPEDARLSLVSAEGLVDVATQSLGA